jgi:hypothetical protein
MDHSILYDEIVSHIYKIITPDIIYQLNKYYSVMTNIFEIFNIDYKMGDTLYYLIVDNNNSNFKINKALNT